MSWSLWNPLRRVCSRRTREARRPQRASWKPQCEVLEGRLAPASFRGLGDLPGGLFASRAFGVSADGAVVVGASVSGPALEAFRWTPAGGMVGLGDLDGGAFFSQALAVSGDGSFVVGEGTSGRGMEAFRGTEATGLVGLGFLPGGGNSSHGYGVSADGSVVVGGSASAPAGQAFRWTEATGVVGLGWLPGGMFFSQANAVSADGAVVVGRSSSAMTISEAFRWTPATGMVGLGSLPGGASRGEAFGVSADGSVIVGVSLSNPGFQAFRWTPAGGMVGLGDLPGGDFFSQARAASADGSVVVGISSSAAGREAFIWDSANGMRSLREVLAARGLDLTGWVLTEARGVSADGRTIVGEGVNPAGLTEGWIARLNVPLRAVPVDVSPAAFSYVINLRAGGERGFGQVSPLRSAPEGIAGDLVPARPPAEWTGFPTADASFRDTDSVLPVAAGSADLEDLVGAVLSGGRRRLSPWVEQAFAAFI